MNFKPFPVYVGYNKKVTSYQNGKRGKIPTAKVIEWLYENVSDRWQFNWNDDYLDPSTVDYSKFINPMDYIHELNKEIKASAKKNGGTFYFDRDEDRLLFCLVWLSEINEEEYIFWHPV